MKTLKSLALLFLVLGFSSMSFAKTIILVHGAFADGSCWDKVIPLLKAAGHKVVAVQHPLTSLAAGADVTTRAIENETDPVVLVGHSMGGMIITQVGNHAKVESLVYVAAFAPDENQSIIEMTAAYPPSPGFGHLEVDKFGFAKLTEQGMTEDFAQDLTAEEQSTMTSTQGPTSTSTLTEKATVAGWKNKPTSYIVAENDRMIQPDQQRDFAKKLNATTVSMATSHVPLLSKPTEVAAVILAAAATAPTPPAK